MAESDREQLDRVLGLLDEILGPSVTGAYLFGSAVTGELRPRSDLDVLAASSRPLTATEKQALVERIIPISWEETPAGMLRGIELTVVAESDVKPWRYPPRRDFQYGNWVKVAVSRGEPEPWAATLDPDLASLLAQVLDANVTLRGRRPAQVFDPVPFADVVDAIVTGVDHWIGNIESDTRNAILALARIWSALGTGRLHSKEGGAEWVLERLPAEHRPAVERARAIYLSGDEDRWDDMRQQVRGYAEYVLRQIRALRDASDPARPRD